MRLLAAFRASKRAPWLQVTKSAVAIALSWFAALWLLGAETPIFAAIAALLVVQPSVNQSFAKGIERSIGVVIGVIVASLVIVLFGSASWVVLIATAIALAVGWSMKMKAGTSNQIAISAMLVLALGASQPNYSVERIIETVIGAVIGVVVNALIVPPVMIEPARRDMALLGGELAASLRRLGDAIVQPRSRAELETLMIEVRLLRPMRDAAEASIADGVESLSLNPRRSRHRADLRAMRELLEVRFTPIVTQIIGMTRAYVDHYDDELSEEPTALAIAEQLHRAAHDIRLAVHIAEVDPAPITSAIPALTAPLDLSPPRSGHWVLIGSLTEDLRRIRDELKADVELTETTSHAIRSRIRRLFRNRPRRDDFYE